MATAPLTVAALLRRDLARYRGTRPPAAPQPPRLRLLLESLVFRAGFQAVVLYRISHWLGAVGATRCAWLVARVNLWLTGADIEFSAHIGPGLLVAHPSGIVIGRGTRIGAGATIYHGVTCGIRSWSPGRASEYPQIGDDVVLYVRASILGGVRVGDRAVVGAHALVTHDLRAEQRAS
jgi:serine O-acetyltransferase